MAKSNALYFMFVLLLTFGSFINQGTVCAEETNKAESQDLVLNKDNKKATVEIDSQQLDISIAPLDQSDYDASDKSKNFNLAIGKSCNLEIEAYKDRKSVLFKFLNSNEKSPISDPTSFQITSSNVNVVSSSDKRTISCKVDFEKHPDDNRKSIVSIELSGDIPEHLKLTSTAKLYNAKTQDAKKKTWMIVGSIVIVVLLLSLILVIIGIFCSVVRRNKAKKQHVIDSTAQAPVVIAKTAEQKEKSASKEEAKKNSKEEDKKASKEGLKKDSKENAKKISKETDGKNSKELKDESKKPKIEAKPDPVENPKFPHKPVYSYVPNPEVTEPAQKAISPPKVAIKNEETNAWTTIKNSITTEDDEQYEVKQKFI